MIVLAGSTDAVDSVAFAPTGPLLAVGHNYRWVGVWDVGTQQLVDGRCRNSSYARHTFRFHPTLPRLYGLRAYGVVEWFDPVAKEAEIIARGTGWAEQPVLTRSADRLLVWERGHCQFWLFDLKKGRGGKLLWEMPVYSRVVWGVRVRVELFPDEERFLVAEDHDNSRTRLSIRSMKTGKLLDTAPLPTRNVTGLALAPDGRTAVTIAKTAMFVHDAEELHAPPRKVANGNRKHFTGIAFHPSGNYLAATSNDETVKLYDTMTWQVMRTFTWQIGRLRCMAFNPDGTLAAAGSETGNVVVWDVDV